MYPYLYRVVGADARLTEAMMALFHEMGWNYVTIVYFEDAFGYDAVKNLLINAPTYDVCIADTIGTYIHHTDRMTIQTCVLYM